MQLTSAKAPFAGTLPTPWDGPIHADEDFYVATLKIGADQPHLAWLIANEAHRQAEARGNEPAIAYALLRKCTALKTMGGSGYEVHCEEARRIAYGLTDERLKVRTDLAFQGCLTERGEYAESLVIGYQALERALHNDFEDLLNIVVNGLVISLTLMGEFEQALTLIRERTVVPSGDAEMSRRASCVFQHTEASLLLHLALERHENGRDVECAEALSASRLLVEKAHSNLPVGREQYNGWMIFDTHCLVLLTQGDVRAARKCVGEFEAGLQTEPMAGSLFWGCLELARVSVGLAAKTEDPVRAVGRLQAVHKIDHPVLQTGESHERLLDLLCRACEAAGRYEEALAYHRAWSRSRLQARSRELRQHAKLGRAAVLQLRGEAAEFITHDLRSPLASVIMQLDSIAAEPQGPQSAERLRAAARSARRAMEIADRALHITRVDSIDFDALTSVDLGMIVEEVCEQLRPTRGDGIELRYAGAAGSIVRGDWDLLSRALGNLVDNALKHSPAAGVVDVSIDRVDGRIEVCVRDQGPGISKDMRRRMFQRYATGRDGGYGLGLTLVSRVARLHKAKLSVETAEGQGTCIRLAFPESKRQAATPPGELMVPSPQPR